MSADGAGRTGEQLVLVGAAVKRVDVLAMVSVTRRTVLRENGTRRMPLPWEFSTIRRRVMEPSPRTTVATAPEMPAGPFTESPSRRDPVRLAPAVNA